MSLSRRQFVQLAVAGTVLPPALGAGPAAKLPTRTLGRSGIEVSILGFGSGSRFLMYKEEDKALEALSKALDLGITYIDTAQTYGNGVSEERIGKLMPERRKQVTLATKIAVRTADEARREIALSLKRLQTDHLDVLHIHALTGLEDLAAIEKPDGVLKALYEARDQKITRAIGITCHASPIALKTALERHDFDCTQMALNAAMARMADAKGGMKATPMSEGSFEELALPVAVRKNLGIIAMKIFGQDQIVGVAPVEQLLRYTLSLPVSLASLGMPKPEFIEQNIAMAQAFMPMSDAERRNLSKTIAAEHKLALAAFLHDHRDA